MATVVKDFKIKNGLIVEGTTGTINNYDILTKSSADTTYIQGLVGGVANSESVANAIVLRDGNANFAANTITADLVGDVDGQVSDISNHSTDSLSEGVNNLYFSNARAQAALSGMYDPAGSAANAQSAAESFATSAAANAQSAAESFATSAAANAQSAAESYAESYTDNAITALNLGGTYDALGAADTAYNNAIAYAEDYTDNAVAALVDSAPALLDTLNELAAAIADNPNYASDIANLISTKADTSYVDTEISDLDTAAQGYASSAQTAAENYAANAAANAYSNAVSYADGLAINYDAAGSAANAQSAAETFATNAINALDTDDIEEGTSNKYFTDSRAKDAAGDLLANASKTNISISYSPLTQVLTVEAENGVADSTTDDLDEGINNLYFSNARAVSALEAVVPNFTAVEIDSLAKQVAATTEVATASTVTAFSWAAADYRTAKFLVKTAYGTHTDVSEVLLTLDTSDNVAITEYAMVGTNGSAMTVSADVSGSDVRLRVATVNNNSTVTVVGTLLA